MVALFVITNTELWFSRQWLTVKQLDSIKTHTILDQSSSWICLLKFSNFSFFELKLFLNFQNFTRDFAKIPSQSRSRPNIYLRELTNVYWSMKHRGKNSLKFSFFRCFGGVAEIFLFVCIGFRRRCLHFRAVFFSSLLEAFLMNALDSDCCVE